MTVATATRLESGLLAVYRRAFAEPPWNERVVHGDAFRQRLAEHAARPGFRLAVARDGTGGLVGFAYGFPTLPPLGIDGWPSPTGAFQLAELAVVPEARRRGFGSRLHDVIIAGAAPGLAWLLTDPDASEALSLYERCGWEVLAAVPALPGSRDRLLMSRAAAPLPDRTIDRNLPAS